MSINFENYYFLVMLQRLVFQKVVLYDQESLTDIKLLRHGIVGSE